ncbi:hypothetical protein GTQ99_14900 [Kineococcus sp. T13]|uniref:hypothetical protein n=1 Tax=Kineococcus vitellinus TaxID=2696565 RepID=UPI0014128C83|nr:hypothetical protein [Kineococcus vitellinus]NAZ76698.1 hypothetical protein [Kineococcus vitellinus]
MLTVLVSLAVILFVAALVGRVCSRTRPGQRRSADGDVWPGVAGGTAGEALGGSVELPDTGIRHHHSHSSSHSTHDGGGWGWGGDGGGSGGDGSGGGGGGD